MKQKEEKARYDMIHNHSAFFLQIFGIRLGHCSAAAHFFVLWKDARTSHLIFTPRIGAKRPRSGCVEAEKARIPFFFFGG